LSASVIAEFRSEAARLAAFDARTALIRLFTVRKRSFIELTLSASSESSVDSSFKRLDCEWADERSATKRAAIDAHRPKDDSNQIASVGVVIAALNHRWISCG
jgi:hypothetical protein